jgi:hypothetical protein
LSNVGPIRWIRTPPISDQCHDKRACDRREQLRDPFRHREVKAEERDLGGVFVDEDKDQQDE